MPNFTVQILNLLAATLLLLTFAMLSQRRILSLIHLFTLHGATLVASALVVAYVTNDRHLYFSAGLTFALKVVLIPWILHKLILRLKSLLFLMWCKGKSRN